METGTIVEFIDRQKIICAVVLEVKKSRLRLLTENNREVNLSTGRLFHVGKSRLDLSLSRDRLVESLRRKAHHRGSLIGQIDIQELWEVLNTEQEWIDLETMTEFCFPGEQDGDHESAVVRAFFDNRLYFKFSPEAFFPHTEEKVERLFARAREEKRRERLIEEGANWIREQLFGEEPPPSAPPIVQRDKEKFIQILESYYLFQKESPHAAEARAMLSAARVDDIDMVFDLLVRVGHWDIDENLDLPRMGIPINFEPEVLRHAEKLPGLAPSFPDPVRYDLTGMSMITIDGQSTLDFDDAISIEKYGKNFRLGIHIADVGHYIRKGTPLDEEAKTRASSIYMPDLKIPMIPASLAEDLCSLKKDTVRPAISIMLHITPMAEVLEYEIFPSLIGVTRQLTYFEANLISEQDPEIATLHQLARAFQQNRLNKGAIQITLPEVNIWLTEEGKPTVSRTNRESPGRLLVSEIMILANWIMARFLAKNTIPAIFRSQPAPKERLYKANEGSLFQNWMQRKLLSRFLLSPRPEHHTGLGLSAYITATSPIRKYFDLVTQRQIRAAMGLENPYSEEDIAELIQVLTQPMTQVARLQFRRSRYWLLKYLETQIGSKQEALVLQKRRNAYQILLSEFMIECTLPVSSGISLKPEDLIQVTVQHVNARKDILSVYLG